MSFLTMPKPLFMAETGAAPSAAGSAPAGGGASLPAASGAGDLSNGASLEGSAAAAAAWKAPDFLPENLRDADVAKTFDKVSNDWKRLRDEVAKIPPAPKSVDEYAFEPSDKLKPYVPNLKDDPVFNHARAAALKAGIPAPAFTAFVGSLYEGMVDAKALPEAYSAERERDALIGDRAKVMTPEQKDAEIRPILAPIVGFLDGLKRTGVVDDAGYAELGALLDRASGVRALAKVMDLATKGSPGLVPGGQSGSANIGPADLKSRQRDPRNDQNSPQFDRAFRDETTRLYQRVYGS